MIETVEAGASDRSDGGVVVRERLGNFSSVVCLKAIITGMEDLLGVQATAISLTSAGRARGKVVFSELGVGKTESMELLSERLDAALGEQGTRLCSISGIERDGDILHVRASETVCSAGEVPGSDRKCTYTLGVVWGALEQVLDRRLRGTHTESVLRGGTHDVFRFEPR